MESSFDRSARARQGARLDTLLSLRASRAETGGLVRPAEADIWFSATTGAAISRRARAAAAQALDETAGAGPADVAAWYDTLRERVGVAFGCDDAWVFLAEGPAQAREQARRIARALFRSDLYEIATAPAECADFRPSLRARARIAPLRAPDGAPRPGAAIDRDALELARGVFSGGGDLLLHALDASRGGLAGVSRDTARAILEAAPDRALALVDASEGRACPHELGAALRQGMMVLVGGSLFLGGAPGAAALLAPRALIERVGARPPTPNVALALRWRSALAEHDAYQTIAPTLRRAIYERFARKARARAARSDAVLLPPACDDASALHAAVVLASPASTGADPFQDAGEIRAALAASRPGVAGDARCRLGAPLRVGAAAALPIAPGAPLAIDVALRMAAGADFAQAFAPVERDLDTLFSKWESVSG